MTSEQFYFFWKHRLSQWHMCDFEVDGIVYNCAEQYMMAQKALLFGDEEAHTRIMASDSPAEQKKIGREVKGYNDEEWDKIARDVVRKGNLARFRQNQDQKELLLSTGNKLLVETSPSDPKWGIGMRKDDPRALDRSRWKGTNWLGQILTEVRNQIREEENGS